MDRRALPKRLREQSYLRPHPDFDTSCWIWTGCRTSDGYYGKISWRSGTLRVHRLAYELILGPIPGKLTVDHLCGRHRCMNPLHMEVVTNSENVARGNRNRRAAT